MIGTTATAMSRRCNCGLTAVAIDNSATNLATRRFVVNAGTPQQNWRNGPDLGVPAFRDRGSKRPWSRDRPQSRPRPRPALIAPRPDIDTKQTKEMVMGEVIVVIEPGRSVRQSRGGSALASTSC